MDFREAYLSSSLRPGELMEALNRSVEDGDYAALEPPVSTLTRQKEVADQKLEGYLGNLSDSPGARKVVEAFYTERHGVEIDASDVEELREHVPDVESILEDDALPVVSKRDLREKYGVEGAWVAKEGEVKETPSLAPDWVREEEGEPYLMNSTGGTTGEPWYRAMTRNDTAMVMAFCITLADDIAAHEEVSPDEMTVANPWPHPASRSYISESVEHVGMEVREFDHEKLTAGGREEREAVERLVDYLDEADNTFLVYPIKMVFEGGLGVEVRRGNVDLDVVLNAGAPFAEHQREQLESRGCRVLDLYGETEYPELAMAKEVDGVEGYDLPMNCQLNLIYDPDSGELSYEGSGRFAYFPYGIEGQVMPGVYLSGVNATIERVDGHQLLTDVRRVEGSVDGCAQG